MEKAPRMEYLRALTRIESRFATTLVSSRFVNENEKPSEAVFTVTLPQAAFISHFTMCVDGKTIVGEVKEKEKAKVQYERAKERGESAGHIEQAPRETNVFHISANISSGGEATFNLNYQEIVQRVHGAYKHVVNIQPQQVVDDIKVDVFIKEACQIKTVKVPKFGSKVGERANVELLSGEEEKNVKIDFSDQSTAAHITYYPSIGKQNQVDGQFVVLYDVERQENGGELQVVNGYFVHFFSPSGLPPAPKHVIFALDKSGSMRGRKIQQTKEAMRKILNDLNEEDRFNILTFSDYVCCWKSESVRATPAAIGRAINEVDEIQANGGTNIHQVLHDALSQIGKRHANSMNNCMIILLTDGQATVGECSTQAIVGLTKQLNKKLKVSIQCVGFGADADFELLKKISMENEGLARLVYEDSDADLQLRGFYEEISQLILNDVKVKYLDERVMPDSIIQNSNRKLYEGGEFVMVGKMAENDDCEIIGDDEVEALNAEIQCLGLEGEKKYKPLCIKHPELDDTFKREISSAAALPPESVGGFVERMWAYLSIKQLLDKAKYASSGAQTDQLKERALQLSLKYQFVTELTSMVVTQSDEQIQCGLQGFNYQSDSELSYSHEYTFLSGPILQCHIVRRQLVGDYDRSSVGIRASSDRPRRRRSPAMSCISLKGFKSFRGKKSKQSKAKAQSVDINDSLPKMPLAEVVQLDWEAVLPLLRADTINSLPLATLSAIPWDDVIMFIQPCVFGGLNESVLQLFPNTAWRKVTVDQLTKLSFKSFNSLSVETHKEIQTKRTLELETYESKKLKQC